ncbi:MAG: acyltransferase [Bacteroidaceae bacterium]|nr:acyltransferase [Bacteroidaceae bacterium]
MKSRLDWNRNQSQAIDLLRFPLMVIVVFGHTLLTTVSVEKADFPLLSGQGVYNALSVMFTYVIPHMTVPVFFMMSGYLFFRNFNLWSWQIYREKIRKRFWTLLVPYILWNIIPVIVNLFRYSVLAVRNHSADGVIDYIRGVSLWSIFVENVRLPWPTNILGWNGCYLTGPLNGTLWFMQDLIVLSIISPVIYYLIKKTKVWLIVLFAVGYVVNITIPVHGLSFNGLLFFSVGGYFVLSGRNFCEFSRRHVGWLLPATLVFCGLGVYYGGIKETYGLFYTYLYTISCSFLAFAIASFLIEKYGLKPNRFLTRCTFFIFGMQMINILGVGLIVQICRDFLYSVIGMDSYLQLSIANFLTPALTAGVCMLTYYLLNRFMPGISAILSGNRSKDIR